MHRSAFARIFKVAADAALPARRRVEVADVADLVAALTEAGYKRETIRKTRTVLAQTLDFYAVDPNPVRDERVRLPRERQDAYPAAARRPRRTGRRAARTAVRAAAARDRRVRPARVRARDRPRRRPGRRTARDPCPAGGREERAVPLPRTCPTTCSRRSLATLPPREDRDLEAPLFPGLDEAALRMAIGRACKLAGVPHFSPHGLRRRRGSLHYKRTGSLAEVAELLGDSKRVAADHYVYALIDYGEVDRRPALRRLFA